MSANACAGLADCSRATILSWLRHFDLPVREHASSMGLWWSDDANRKKYLASRSSPGFRANQSAAIRRSWADTAHRDRRVRSLAAEASSDVGRQRRSDTMRQAWARDPDRLSGPNNPNWKGQDALLPTERGMWLRRQGGELWRRACKRRDGYACALCGTTHHHRTDTIHVHHLLSFAEYPEFRGVLENGRSICKRCPDGRGHEWLHSNEGKHLRDQWEAEMLPRLVEVG